MKKCSVKGCKANADVAVMLYDVYPGSVFMEQDFTCPYLCFEHMWENDMNAKGMRGPRANVEYLYTNRNQAVGFTIYRRLDRPWPELS